MIEQNLLKLEKNLFKQKKYYAYDDIKYKGIRSVRNLFDLSIDEDYYKPIITNGAFNNNYIQYDSKGNKDSEKDSDETRTMRTKSNNVEIMMGRETD